MDSLPFNQVRRMNYLQGTRRMWPIDPGFGYSVNIHAELFAGLSPDRVGFFGEWMYNPLRSPGRRFRRILPFLDKLLKPYILNRGLQHLMTRSYQPGHIMPNLPLRFLDKFSLEGAHIHSSRFPKETLFDTFRESLFVLEYRNLGVAKGERDQVLFRRGLEAIRHRGDSLWIPFPDLDGIGHRRGIDSFEYEQHLLRLDSYIKILTETFLERHPRGVVAVVSDHGMVNVQKGVYLDIEEEVGPATERSYLYFSDATLLRVWVFDRDLLGTIGAYLNDLEFGRIVSEEERRRYGLVSERFGDFIFVLNEGLAFRPSTFARNIPRAMHGYHPELPSQRALLVLFGREVACGNPTRMNDLFQLQKGLLSSAL